MQKGSIGGIPGLIREMKPPELQNFLKKGLS
jgi:hypothetical protein